MIRIISKKAGKPATKTAKPAAAKSASKTLRKPKAEATVEAPEVRKTDPEMPDALNRLDPKVDAIGGRGGHAAILTTSLARR